MGNLLDYIDWRGDLSFEQSSFNKIDTLILCQIAYLKFDGLLKDLDFSDRVSLNSLADLFRNASDYNSRSDTGLLINKLTLNLLYSAAGSRRFRDVKVCGYHSVIDLEEEEQFAAMTFILDDKISLIAFRGTDDNIIGWKEDFNLGIMDEVPSQKDAVKYLRNAAKNIKGMLYIGGHSKGGNLSVYSAARMPLSIKKRIISIFNADGPGFAEKRLECEDFKSIMPLVQSYYPQLSIIGMLFSNAGHYSVVKSDEQGVMQHDPFSWNLIGAEFITVAGFDKASEFIRETVNRWINEMSQEQREILVETLFKVIRSTDARTNRELDDKKFSNSLKIVSAVNNLDPEIRKSFMEIIREYLKIVNNTIPKFNDVMEKAREKSEDFTRKAKEKSEDITRKAREKTEDFTRQVKDRIKNETEKVQKLNEKFLTRK